MNRKTGGEIIVPVSEPPRYNWWKLLALVPPVLFTAQNPTLHWLAFAAGVVCGLFVVLTLWRYKLIFNAYLSTANLIVTPIVQSVALVRLPTPEL